MIDSASRRLAAGGHILAIVGIFLYLWMLLFYESTSYFQRDKVEVAIPIITACLLILGKALAIPAAIVTGHDGALKTSLYCDIGGIVVNGVLASGVLNVGSVVMIGLMSVGASVIGFVFFLNYLQGTAEYAGDSVLASIPGRLYRGCSYIVLAFLVTILSLMVGLAPFFVKLMMALVALWLAAYVYLIGGTAYHLLQGRQAS